MKKQTKSVPGLSENAKLKRINNNLVTMKYNVINNILTILSLLIFLIMRSDIALIVYLSVIACGSPLVYLFGIEENRKNLKKLLKSNLEASDKMENREASQHPEQVPPMINNWI